MEITKINPVIADAFRKPILASHAIESGKPFDTDLFAFAAVENNRVLGTIEGYSLYDWVYVNYLVVDRAYRGKGIGSRLLDLVEESGRNSGRRGVQIDTFRYQAPEFYKARGYCEKMILEGREPELDRIYLALRFANRG